jgi:hypothetical protein
MLIGSRVSISIGVVAVLISNCGNLFFAIGGFWRKVDVDYVALLLVDTDTASLLLSHWH